MRNLYSMTTTHQAMHQLFRVQSGINQLRLPGIFPDYQAPSSANRLTASASSSWLVGACRRRQPSAKVRLTAA